MKPNEPDAQHPLTRREVLGMLGSAGAAALGGATLARSGVSIVSEAHALSPASLACVVSPAQTEGPYFVDARLDRSDVRVDPTNGSTRPGVPLRLRLNVVQVDGNACKPLSGAVVEIWQCDAVGIYSDVLDFQGLFDTRGQKFLRGHQVSDSDGRVEFLTVYPGWYSGRAVHIHFKVRLNAGAQRGHELTSQLYFEDSISDLVYAQAPYNTKGKRDTLNSADRIYRGIGRDGKVQTPSGSQLMVNVARDGEGYAGTYSIGLRLG